MFKFGKSNTKPPKIAGSLANTERMFENSGVGSMASLSPDANQPPQVNRPSRKKVRVKKAKKLGAYFSYRPGK